MDILDTKNNTFKTVRLNPLIILLMAYGLENTQESETNVPLSGLDQQYMNIGDYINSILIFKNTHTQPKNPFLTDSKEKINAQSLTELVENSYTTISEKKASDAISTFRNKLFAHEFSARTIQEHYGNNITVLVYTELIEMLYNEKKSFLDENYNYQQNIQKKYDKKTIDALTRYEEIRRIIIRLALQAVRNTKDKIEAYHLRKIIVETDTVRKNNSHDPSLRMIAVSRERTVIY